MTAAEAAVLRVFADNTDKVLSRHTVLRLAGMQHCSLRRCDGIVSNLRQMLGDESIITVRGRGWMLCAASLPHALAALSQFPA